MAETTGEELGIVHVETDWSIRRRERIATIEEVRRRVGEIHPFDSLWIFKSQVRAILDELTKEAKGRSHE